MIKKGARKPVLIGRSSTHSAKVIELLKRYEGTDVCVRAIACDVGSHTDLIRTAETLRGLPKVRSIIHGALYLRVSQRELDREFSTDNALGCITHLVLHSKTGSKSRGQRLKERGICTSSFRTLSSLYPCRLGLAS